MGTGVDMQASVEPAVLKQKNLQYEQQLHLEKCPELVIKDVFYFCRIQTECCHLLILALMTES